MVGEEETQPESCGGRQREEQRHHGGGWLRRKVRQADKAESAEERRSGTELLARGTLRSADVGDSYPKLEPHVGCGTRAHAEGRCERSCHWDQEEIHCLHCFVEHLRQG